MKKIFSFPTLYIAICLLTALICLPFVIAWSVQFGMFFGAMILMLYTNKKLNGKKIEDFYRDLWNFGTSFPYFRPWSFYMSLWGSPTEVMAKARTNHFNEIAYLKTAVVNHWRVWIVVRYLSMWLACALFPLLGTALWFFNRSPSRVTVRPPSQLTEKGIKTVINLDVLSEQQIPSKERWFFVNGMGIDFELAKLNALNLAAVFNKNIELIYKPSYGILYDLGCTLGGRTFEIPSATDMTLRAALHEALMNDGVDKIVLIAHSKGSVVACNAVCKMIEEGNPELKKRIEKKLEVYNFANCSDCFTVMEKGPHYESFANPQDMLANLSGKAEPKVEKIPSASIHLSSVKEATHPRVFTHKDTKKGGHLLGAHYLSEFTAAQYVGADDQSSKLFSYLPKA